MKALSLPIFSVNLNAIGLNLRVGARIGIMGNLGFHLGLRYAFLRLDRTASKLTVKMRMESVKMSCEGLSDIHSPSCSLSVTLIFDFPCGKLTI